MKNRAFAFLFFFLLLNISAAKAQQCFKVFSGGVEVTVLCVGEKFTIQNCSVPFTQDSYCLDATQINNPNCYKVNLPGTTFDINTPGEHTITQLIGTGTGQTTISRKFQVKPAPKPKFKVVQCGNNSVRVTINDVAYTSYKVKAGSNPEATLQPNQSQDFTVSGNSLVMVTGRHLGSNCGGDSTATFQAYAAPTAPIILNLNVLTSSSTNGEIRFSLGNLVNGYQYFLEDENGIIDPQKPTFTANTSANDFVTVSGLNTSNPTCYRFRVFDLCGNNKNIVSERVCSMILTATLNPQTSHVTLTWPPYKDITANVYYEVKRKLGNSTHESLMPNQFTGTTFIDSTAICGNNYCYELFVHKGNTVISQSNNPCVLITSTIIPEGGQLLTSFQPDNSIMGTLKLPSKSELKNLNVFRNNDINFTQIRQTTEPVFTDSNPNFRSKTLQYQTTFEDKCGNTSRKSNISIPALLTATYDTQNRLTSLSWTNYQGFTGNNVTYTLEMLDANSIKISEIPVTGNTFAFTEPDNEKQVLKFRIKVISEVTGELSYSNTETIKQEAKVFVPSAFSPNGDNLNDIFEAKARFQNNFNLVILNRWGQVIFETSDPKKGWDGKFNGTLCPVGVYVYRLNATDETGRKFSKNGTVTIVK